MTKYEKDDIVTIHGVVTEDVLDGDMSVWVRIEDQHTIIRKETIASHEPRKDIRVGDTVTLKTNDIPHKFLVRCIHNDSAWVVLIADGKTPFTTPLINLERYVP